MSILGSDSVKSDFKIPFILSDGAIIQRNKIIPIWGYYLPDKEINISFCSRDYKARSDSNGRFEIRLPAHDAGGPFDLIFKADDQKLEVKDILFGDVWLLSGQSNMQLWMDRLKSRYPKEIEAANNSNIRFFIVPQRFEFKSPVDELESGDWEHATGEALKQLSGIGYFFAKQSYENLQVPVGLISTAIGGTHITSWMSKHLLKSLGELPDDFKKLGNDNYVQMIQNNDAEYEQWYQNKLNDSDTGLLQNWQSIDIDDSKWDTTFLNQPWNSIYQTPGTVWLRKSIRIPIDLIGQNASLRFGTFTDADEIYVNGELVGSTDYKYPPREYKIGKLTESLELVIRLKIYNSMGGPTFNKRHQIFTANKNIDVDNLGEWQIKRGNYMPSKREQTFFQYEPTGLFNGMIYSIKNVRLKGILWYQGESDTGMPYGYSRLLIHMIQEWRELFKDHELPFLFVQLPNCGIEPQHDWALLRSEQEKALVLKRTAMIVSLGLGENNDLHPTNKLTVSKYLWEASQSIDDFSNGYCNGPLVVSAIQKRNEIWIKFQTFNKKLKLENGSFVLIDNFRKQLLNDFYLSGQYIVIKMNNEQSLSRDAVLRYAWNNTPSSFIYNDANIPAAPFEIKVHPISIDSKS